MPSLIPAALGVGAGLILIIIVLILLLTLHTRRRRPHDHRQLHHHQHHVHQREDTPIKDDQAEDTATTTTTTTTTTATADPTPHLHHHTSTFIAHHTSCIEREMQVSQHNSTLYTVFCFLLCKDERYLTFLSTPYRSVQVHHHNLQEIANIVPMTLQISTQQP